MQMQSFDLQESDVFLVNQYRDFLPTKVFDAHMHLPYLPSLPSVGGKGVHIRDYMPEDYMRDMGALLPGVETIRLNMIPTPSDRALHDGKNGLRDLGNGHVFRAHELYPEHVATPLILPGDSEEFLFRLAARPGCRGLKCYAYLAGEGDPETVEIGQYLPEAAWVVANTLKLPIFLHLFRKEALSDPDNFRYVTTMSHRYPNAQLVLCHCARGFAAWTMMKSIKELEDHGNIWFDLSAICESGPIASCILKNAGKRTLWGSDYPVTMYRGRPVSVGSGQNWLTGDCYQGPERAMVAAENLMAFYHAALLLDLDQTQIGDIFYNNAVVLFGEK